MLAYAPRSTARTGSPRTLLLVAAGHAVALGLILTARSEFAPPAPKETTEVYHVEPIKPPPPTPPVDPAPQRQPADSVIDRAPVIIPMPARPSLPLDDGPPVTDSDPVIGNAVTPAILPLPEPPIAPIVRKAARFVTPTELVRPPYPLAKQRLEEEASLRLSLAIDTRGRVTAVSPVGSADPVFLDAARRHIVRHWRYQPATEDGTAIASTIVVTLRFKLDE